MPLTGEETQALGAEGSERAKRWLEATCRASVLWTNPGPRIEKLQFTKASVVGAPSSGADTFSFDLGGNLLGGAEDGELFLGEVKFYKSSSDQGTEYPLFLAKCYRVEESRAGYCNRYLWITWAPFSISKWKDLLTADYVKQSVTGSDDATAIALGPDAVADDVIGGVADKLMIVVLSERQEKVLSLNARELVGVRQALIGLRGGT